MFTVGSDIRPARALFDLGVWTYSLGCMKFGTEEAVW